MGQVEQKAKKRPPPAAYGMLLVAECLVWGFSNAFSKLGFDQITPIWCLVFRYIISLLLFLAFFGKRFIRKYKKADLWPCVVVSLFTAGAFILGFAGLAYTSATNCGFLMSLAAVFAPLLAIPILKTKFQWKLIFPMLIAVLGLFLFTGGNLTRLALGDILALLCSVLGAFMLVTSSKYLKSIDAIVLCVIQCAVCLVACVAAALLFEPLPRVASFTPIVWYIVAYSAIFCTFLAYLFQNIALARVSPTFGAMVFCTEPIFTAVAAYFLLGERLSLPGFAGAALILAGIVLASLFEGRGKPVSAENPPDSAEAPSVRDETIFPA